MIGRIISLALVSAFTATAVAGILLIIVLDMFGEEALLKFWQTESVTRTEVISLTGLEDAWDITFFIEAPVQGSALKINTGIRFQTVNDLLAKRQSARWCYVVLQVQGTLPRQVELAAQSGTDAPTFNNLSIYPEAELSVLGVNASTLETIARSHCRFSRTQSAGHDGDVSNMGDAG